MKMTRKIFGVISVLAIAGVMSCAHAAGDGCDDSNNDIINPALALCTTHAYNIGEQFNPTDPATAQDMNMVIAMKTTVITQQMYQQYQNLDAVMKRLKTQLEKAVLTTKLQMASGGSDNANGNNNTSNNGGTSGSNQSLGKNIYFDGARNCDNENTTLDVLKCLQDNTSSIEDMLNKNVIDARKQLQADLKIAKSNSIYEPTMGNDTSGCATVREQTTNQRSTVEKCLSAYKGALRTKRGELEQATQKKEKD